MHCVWPTQTRGTKKIGRKSILATQTQTFLFLQLRCTEFDFEFEIAEKGEGCVFPKRVYTGFREFH